jgi:hypothetical protein
MPEASDAWTFGRISWVPFFSTEGNGVVPYGIWKVLVSEALCKEDRGRGESGRVGERESGRAGELESWSVIPSESREAGRVEGGRGGLHFDSNI